MIVNEYGEVRLDHMLVQWTHESTILLGSGCIFCTVRGDLVDTLGNVSMRRLRAEPCAVAVWNGRQPAVGIGLHCPGCEEGFRPANAARIVEP